ncbi:MAG TPA: DNA-processing protein DprA [Terriglobia bacterium]|nr:DNA-processing protein DprA [Terriglobia bacterium]
MESTLTPDTQAVLLLCGELGQRGGNGPKPLGLRQYNVLASWLKSAGLRPGDLLSTDGRMRLAGFQSPELDSIGVTYLLDRGAALALIVERWERGGLWVISRSDASYPERLKKYLGQTAPPLLYGVGSKCLLNRGGLVVVGSRDSSEEDAEFARRVGEHCAKEGIAVISGAAKGIDREAMSGALETGGWALGVLAEGLARTATSGQYRSGLVSDRLTLLSPYDPDSRWFVYAAMERNKLLYGLGDAALVVASSAETGGTWAGATEALQHGRVKVFVKSTGVIAPGNSRLLRMGSIPFPPEPWENLRGLFTPPEEKNGQLFPSTAQQALAMDERANLVAEVLNDSPSTEATAAAVPTFSEIATLTEPTTAQRSSDAYSLVIEQMLSLLTEPRTEEWLADRMHVRVRQIKDWLARGVREGRITRLRKPVRYVAHTSTLFSK